MDEAQARRIDEALSSLVHFLVPVHVPKDDEGAGETHNNALELARTIIKNHKPSAVVPEFNHLSDLIKSNLLRESDTPDKAVKFSSLSARLLAQPVVHQKCSILYLLHLVADFDSGEDGSSGSEVLQIEDVGTPRTLVKTSTDNQRDAVSPHVRDAFSAAEQPRLPVHRSPSREVPRSPPREPARRPSREVTRRPPRGTAQSLSNEVARPPSNEIALPPSSEVALPPSSEVSRPPSRDVPRPPTKETALTFLKEVARSPLREITRPPSREVARLTPSSEGSTRRKPEESQDGFDELLPQDIDGLDIRPTEVAILRDLPYTLQGISTAHLKFTSSSELTLPRYLPLPLLSLLHTLAEPSLLYRGLSESVQSPVEGLVAQSLISAVGNELRSYLALVATLEGEIRRSATSLESEGSQGSLSKVGVTLKRCVVWTREATLGLRLMSLMVERAKSKKGGQLISAIHTLSSSHGDPFVATFAERMLVHVTKPFYDMLRQWIYDGELSDPYHEYFVIENVPPPKKGHKGADSKRAQATNEWEEKYTLDKKMVPTIMSEDLSRKAFLIGKSLNFIRYGCGDAPWVEAYCRDASRDLRYGDTATLEASIDKAYRATMARLTHLMSSKFHLFEHLRALKNYLLLCQGDFIALLMESLAPTLDRPAGSQYRHNLTGQLEHAIRGSNAQHDSEEILRRLDARVLEVGHGDVGWDVFSLDYKVDSPVNVIITPWATRKYLMMFNFLWRVKRVEFALGSTWRRCMTGARGVLAELNDTMSRDWKAARCCMAEMIHFVNQLQYYILFEVIEASWNRLQVAITKPNCTLDDMIEAHTQYLESITRRGLLGAPRHAVTGTREESFTSQLHYILKNMLAYRDAMDGLYSFSVAEFTRRQERSAKVEPHAQRNTGGGVYTRDEAPRSPGLAMAKSSKSINNAAKARTDSPFPANDILAGSSSGGDSDDQMLPALRARLNELSTDFRSRLNTLLGDLAAQPEVNMKFLGVVMNFNNVYQPRKRRKEATTTATTRKPPAVPNDPAGTGSNTAVPQKNNGASEVGGGGGTGGGGIGGKEALAAGHHEKVVVSRPAPPKPKKAKREAKEEEEVLPSHPPRKKEKRGD